jgi:hypothetical protein
VSMPRNNGPSMPRKHRYRQIACVIAKTCHSLKLRVTQSPGGPTCRTSHAAPGRPDPAYRCSTRSRAGGRRHNA